MAIYKKCKICREDMPIWYFPVRKNFTYEDNKIGSICDQCMDDYGQVYYRINKKWYKRYYKKYISQHKKRNKKYYQANSEHLKKDMAKYYRDNKQNMARTQKRRRNAHIGCFGPSGSPVPDTAARYRQANRESIYAKHKKWRQANTDRIKQYNARYRAKVKKQTLDK